MANTTKGEPQGSSSVQPSQAIGACRPDFDAWAAAVREQMLTALQKRGSN